MNRLNLTPLLVASAVLLFQTAHAQDNLRGIMTVGFGDVAAIKQKAAAGDANAQVDLGSVLVQNFHPAEAIQWYRKAAEQGNPEAAYQVGHLLLFGAAGIPNDQTVKAKPSPKANPSKSRSSPARCC
jgi:TPR repeat protein